MHRQYKKSSSINIVNVIILPISEQNIQENKKPMFLKHGCEYQHFV